MRHSIRFAFSVARLSSKELELSLKQYRLWSIPFNTYPTISFDKAQSNFLTDIVQNRYQLKDHNNLVDKAGLYIISKDPLQISEEELIVFANIQFEDGKNPLTTGNIDHIIKTSISRKDILLTTKLLLCLKSNDKDLVASRLSQEISESLFKYSEKQIISSLILIQKCSSRLEDIFMKELLTASVIANINKLHGKSQLVAQAILYSMGIMASIDSSNVINILQQQSLDLEVVYSIFLIKDYIYLNDHHLNLLFQHLIKHFARTNKQNSWIIVHIFSKLSTLQKTFVIGKLPLQQFHHSDYVLYLEILEQSQLEIQLRGKHLFPYWIKDTITSEQFERVLSLRYELKYDDQSNIPQIINLTFTKSLICFKGLLKFLSTLEIQNELPFNMIAKTILTIFQEDNVKNYDMIQLYNSIALMAKYNLCRNKFWRKAQNYIIKHVQEVIQLSAYISTSQRQQFIANLVLLLKNHIGRSKMQKIIMDEVKMSLGELWRSEGLLQLTSSLESVGHGDIQLWNMIEQNLQMLRKEDMLTNLNILQIIQIMLKMNRGSGYFWRRLGESLSASQLQKLKADALVSDRKLISNYLLEGQQMRDLLKKTQ